MAAGVLPRYGDGKSDPALTDDELSVEAERFDPSVRDGLAAFFRKALDRDPARRFDNAEEMLRAWRELFLLAERETVTTPGGGEVALRIELDQADPETLVAILGLSTRATNALDRVGVTTVRQLLDLPVGDVRFMRGVGKKTRDEIIAALDHLRKRFPKPPEGRRPEDRPAHEPEDPATLDLDALRRKLLGAAPGSKADKAVEDPRAVPGPLRRGDWPSQSEVSARLEVTRQRIGQVVGADRERWAREPAVTALRAELLRTVQAAGGVMALPELADALAAARGTAVEAPRRPPAPGLGPGAAGVRDRAGDGQPPPAPAAGRPGRAAGLHARAGRVRRAAGPGGRRDRGREPAAAPLAGLPAALRGRASPSSRPSARRRTTSGSSAWPPPPATAPPSRPGRNSTPGTWTPAAPCTSAWGP